MTQTVNYQSFEMDMTAETTNEEIRAFVEAGMSSQYDAIDTDAISERAWRLAQERGFVTTSNTTLTDADEIEAYLLDMAREDVRAAAEETISGLIRTRDETFA